MDFLKLKRPKGRVYFSRYEFEGHGFPRKPSALESYLLANLVYKILNPIRIAVGRPMYINDCYRTMPKYRSLIKRGYYPSPTSDHFWGQIIPTIRKRDKKKYGPSYSFSTGAVDFSCSQRYSLIPVFNTIKDLVDSGNLEVGQCIFETKYINENGRKIMASQWIHISNPRDIVYKSEFIEDFKIKPRQFLMSDDSGRTYRLVD